MSENSTYAKEPKMSVNVPVALSAPTLVSTALDDVFVIEKPRFEDRRGLFVKTFNEDAFRKLNLPTSFKECVYSISKQNVLRGMHYQRHPHGHAKLVNVIEGEILDVVVGIGGETNRRNRGKYASFLLSAQNNRSLCIPDGYAHGFLVLSERAVVSYMTTSGYNQESDAGVRFDSFGFGWPVERPIMSDRDILLPMLSEI
jgi:dTDP-4-dehydrorhamnose 3,5-epimerase